MDFLINHVRPGLESLLITCPCVGPTFLGDFPLGMHGMDVQLPMIVCAYVCDPAKWPFDYFTSLSLTFPYQEQACITTLGQKIRAFPQAYKSSHMKSQSLIIYSIRKSIC